MKTEIINMLLLSGAFLTLFGIAECLYHFLKVKAEHSRKLVHFGTGVLTLTFPAMLDNHWLVLALCTSFVGVLAGSLKFNLLKSINAIDRKSYGSLAFPMAVYLSYLAYDFSGQNYLYYYLPILTLAICDPLAALVGRRFPLGKFKIAGGNKTVMGSAIFFLSAFVLSASLLAYFNIDLAMSTLFLQCCGIALVAMFSEAVSGKGMDNLSIPIAVISSLYFLEQPKAVVQIIALLH